MTRQLLYPFKFRPILKQVVWGGDRIAGFKGCENAEPGSRIGESWELSGIRGSESVVSAGPLAGNTLNALLEKYGELLVGEAVFQRYGTDFPLLLKFIDASSDLSVQVHPGDELARKKHQSNGKTELWYVIDAADDASLYAGFNRNTSRSEVSQKIKEKRIDELLNRQQVSGGDVVFLPAGRVHAICGGVFLAEVQQSSDVTYRIWDYDRPGIDGRPRELHIEQALDALDYRCHKSYLTPYQHRLNRRVIINECPYFTVSLIEADTVMNFDYGRLDSFVAWMCIGGEAVYASQRKGRGTIRRGETVLFPACDKPKAFIPTSDSLRLLEIFIP